MEVAGAGAVGGGGGGGAPATAYDVLDTFRLETSTASNAEPGTVRSACRPESFQPGSGAPLRNHGDPLSASTIPCFLSARRITWFCAEKPLMSKLGLEPEPGPHRRIRGAARLAALWLAGQTYAFAVRGAVKRMTWSIAPLATSS